MGVCIAGAAFGVERAWSFLLRRPGPLAETKAIVIPRGGAEGIAKTLVSEGAITEPWMFRLAALVTGSERKLRAAEFSFPPHASLDQILSILRSARPVQHHLTIPEGLTAQQIITIVDHAEAASGSIASLEEGSVLPQTYDYEYGADRAAIIARAKAAMERELATDWANRGPNLPLPSAREALILASIVERETAKPEERPHVAAVYLNRLRLGMRLEADPTVVYGASNGAGVLDHPLTRAELRRDDPFNTYRVPGLPPGPICSPGRDSIEAVMHPAASDDLFFVADGTGGHVFSRTYSTHDAAVARYRALGSHSAQD